MVASVSEKTVTSVASSSSVPLSFSRGAAELGVYRRQDDVL